MINFYELFDDKAILYAKNRPSYSNHFIEYLNDNLNLNSQNLGADIGAGTGQLTKILAEHFNIVYAVEPNESMLSECKNYLAAYNNIIYKCCKAEDINLNSNCLDYITIAQAFHLLNTKAANTELKRLLKPDGRLIIVYNMKNHESELFKNNEKVLFRYCPLYRREFHATEFKKENFKNIFTDKSYDYSIYVNDNTEYIDCDTFIGRTLSSSYSITPGNPFFNNYVKELEEVFNYFAVDKKIKMELSTVIYSGVLR